MMRSILPLFLFMLSAVVAADTVKPVDKVESYVNIRSAPEASAEAVSRLHKSKPRPHVRTLEGWYEVELDDGTTGFVSSDWSVLVPGKDSDASERPEAAIVEAQPPEAPEPAASAEPPETPVPVDAPDEGAPEPETPPEPLAAETVEDSSVIEPVEEAPPEPVEPSTPKPSAVAEAETASTPVGPRGPAGPQGPPGPAGAPGEGAIKGKENFLVKFKKPTVGGNSQIYDDGNRVGIGTVEPEQKLEINGSLQIHDQTSAVAGVMITQIRGETGYILHNQASTLTIGAGSVDRITIDKDGNIGFGVNRPEHPLQLANGAYVTAGGAWTNSSSRSRKENIEALDVEEALAALASLEPVEFNYLSDGQETYLGFIAEDVPELVAMTDRKSLSPMDIVAVLTRVVQEQQAQIRALEQRLDRQEQHGDFAAAHKD